VTAPYEVQTKVQDLPADLRATRSLAVTIEGRFLDLRDQFVEEIGFSWPAGFRQGSALWDIDPELARQQLRSQTKVYWEISPIQHFFLQSPFLQSSGGVSAQIDFLDDIQTTLLINMAQQANESIVSQAPIITTFNTQEVEVQFETVTTYIAGFTALVAEDAAAYQPTTSTRENSVSMSVQPFVSADRKYVQLNIAPDFTFSSDEPVQVPVMNLGDGQVSFLEISLPIETEFSLETTVSVPDEGTLLIGGLALISEDDPVSGLPIISKIPIIRRLFIRDTHARAKETRYFLVKPTILIQEEEEAKHK